MNARGGSRIWLIGGLVAIVALVTATYLLAIKPVYTAIEATEQQIGDAELEQGRLNKQLKDLKKQYEDRRTYAAELADKKVQLPDSYDIPNFLRELQQSDTTVQIDNNSVAVSDPVVVRGATNVVAVPIALTAKTKKTEIAGLSRFLNRLQKEQRRAVLLSTVNLEGLDTDAPTLAISLTAFCSKKTENDCQVAATG
jgi:Tfp pilus assembly protein PilO